MATQDTANTSNLLSNLNDEMLSSVIMMGIEAIQSATESVNTLLNSIPKEMNRAVDALNKNTQVNQRVYTTASKQGAPKASDVSATNAWMRAQHQDMASAGRLSASDFRTESLAKGIEKFFRNPLAQAKSATSHWATRQMAGGLSRIGAGAVGSGIAGLAGGGALLLAIQGLSFVIGQAVSVLKENLSYKVVSGNYLDARKTEALLGNFMRSDNRELQYGGYRYYRSQMRQMGERDEAKIAAQLQQLASMGIAGGPARADLVNAALTKQAIKTNFGIDLSDRFIGSTYRASQGVRTGMFREDGTFGLSKYMQTIALMSKNSTTAFGAQVGMQELSGVVETLTENFRGANNDIGAFVSKLGRYTNLMAENTLKASDVISLMQLSQRTSTQSQFEMLAFSGVRGGDLMDERMRFRQRGTGAEASQNALVAARAALNYYNSIGGGAAEKDWALSEKLNQWGMGNLSKSVADLPGLFSRILAGDDKAIQTYNNAAKTQTDLLKEQAKSLDAIKNPLAHIRDLMFAQKGGSAEAIMTKIMEGASRAMYVDARLSGSTKEDAESLEAEVRNRLDNNQKILGATGAEMEAMTQEIRNGNINMQTLLSGLKTTADSINNTLQNSRPVGR